MALASRHQLYTGGGAAAAVPPKKRLLPQYPTTGPALLDYGGSLMATIDIDDCKRKDTFDNLVREDSAGHVYQRQVELRASGLGCRSLEGWLSTTRYDSQKHQGTKRYERL